MLGGGRYEPDARTGHDAERALAAAEVEIGASLAGSRHRLEGDDLRVGASVADDVQPARVRRDGAADRRTVTCREIDRVALAGARRHRLHRADGRSRARHHVVAVDRHRRESPETDHELAGERHAATDEPRVASLRDDRPALVARRGDEADDLLERSRAGNRRRRPAEPARPVDDVGRHVVGLGQEVRRTDDVGEPAGVHQPDGTVLLMPQRLSQIFLATADVVLDAVRDDAVGAAWDQPSVLEEQTVGSLAGHLARAGGWVVADYLGAGVPEGPATFDSPAAYYAAILGAATEEQHAAIRARGAAVAAEGQARAVETLTGALQRLHSELPSVPDDQLIAAIGGVMLRFDHYLATRIVEQVVHLDDLARSIGREPWPVPADAVTVALGVAVELGQRRFGDAAMVRAVYRAGFADAVLPVL